MNKPKEIMKTRIIAWACALSLPLVACEERVVHKYESENSVYFFKGAEQYNTFVQGDSLLYNFTAKANARQRDTIRVRVLTAGLLSDRERPVLLAQVNHGEASDAVAGAHYVGFDDPEVSDWMVVPAGSAQVDLPIILLRDPSLRSREARIVIELRENSHFKVVMPDLSRFVVKITDMISRPNNWDSLWQYYLGNWGPEKMRFLAEYVGIADFEGRHEASEMLFYQSKAIEKLLEYNNAHEEPLAEADGTLVTFPS
jgi:hypothetical protein